jgi:hypothetical protein
MQQISSEMCALLEEQSKLLNSRAKLTEMGKEELGKEELGRYTYRNERLRQLLRELSELG